MAAAQEPEERAAQLIAESQKLIGKAEAAIAETDAFYSEMGISRGQADSFLANEKKVHPKHRTVIQHGIEEWKAEIEREGKSIERKLQAKGSGHARKKVSRVRI